MIAILSACNFVIGMGAFVVIAMIEPVSDGLSISIGAAGALLTVYAIAFAILSPLLVSVTGGFGRRRVLFAGLAVFAVASLGSALVPGIAALYAARVLAAAGAGLVTPVAAAIAAGLTPPETRGKALAAVFFGLTLAQVIGIPVGSWVAYTYGWRTAFLIVFGLALPCLWLVWTRVPGGLRFEPVSLSDLRRSLANPVAMGSVLFTATFLAAIYILFTYIPPLLSQSMGYGRDGITLVLLVFGGAAVVGNVMGGWLSDRIGPVQTLVLLCLAQIVLMPLFSALPVSGPMLFALVFAWSLAGWSFTAPQQIRVIRLDPPRASVLLALNAASIYIGAALGSALGGAILSGWGVNALGAAAGTGALVALGHLLLSQRAANLSAARNA